MEAPSLVPGQANALRVGVEPLSQGVYTVAWRTVSTADGHASAGSFAFGVGAGTVVSTTPPSPETGTGSGTGSAAGTIVRWLLYLGIAAMLGAGLVGALLHPAAPPRLATFARAGWVLSAIGVVGVVAVQIADSGADVRGFWLSSLAIPAVARLAAGAAGGAAVRLVPWSRRGGYLIVLLAGSAALLIDVLAGHAAAAPQATVATASQFVHGLTAGAWIGGLAALLVAISGESTEQKITAIRRYSTIAAGLLVLVAVTGLLRAIDQIGSVRALVGTDFGRIAIAKSVGLAALASFGALNRFVNIPAIARTFTGLRRSGSAEVGVGVLVFLLSAMLVNAAPPLRTVASTLPPIVVTGSDFGTTVRLQLTATPGTPGFNTFTADAADFDTGAPVDASGVSLRFSLVSQTDVGTSSLDLTQTAPGRFAADGGNLSIDGIWNVTAVVAAPSGAVEVPLALATRIPTEAAAFDASIKPVIYTVSLADGKSAQVYLDPGGAGGNELHVTFFDAAGKELPVPSVTMIAAPTGGAGKILEERQLEAGHFVATVDLPPGDVAVDAVGPDPGGGQLHVALTMRVGP